MRLRLVPPVLLVLLVTIGAFVLMRVEVTHGSWFVLGGGLVLTAVAGLCTVTTERRRRAVREVDRFFALSPEMVIVAGFDGYWKRVNPSVEAILGYSEHESLSRPFMEFVHPDDRGATEAALRDVTGGKTAFAFENRMLCKDGSQKWIEWTATPVAAEEVAYGVGRDVTARHRNATEQAALQDLATLVAEARDPEVIFEAVAEAVSRVVEVPIVSVARYGVDDTVTVLANYTAEGPVFPLGRVLSLAGTSMLSLARDSGGPARIDDYDGLPGEIAEGVRAVGIRSSAGVPIIVAGRVWGAIVASSDERLPAGTEGRLADFTGLLATAIANAESRAALSELAEEQAALRRVATIVAQDASSAEVFDAVAREVAKLLDTDVTILGRYDGDGYATSIGNWSASSHGVPVGTRSAIGGRNVLTMVAETGKPARLDQYDDASGEAADIARRHGWRSSIAAPVVVEGRVWGVMLVATERAARFPAGAEQRLAAFTDLIATAVANAQAHDEVRRFGDEQAALRRVATFVAAGAAPEDVFRSVVDEVSNLLALERIELVRYDGDAGGVVLASSGDHPFLLGTRWPLDGESVMAKVARTKSAARMDGYSNLDGTIARDAQRAGFRSAIGAPITVDGRLWGVIIAISTDLQPIPERAEGRLAQFTTLVATAVANAESKSELAASRRRIVAASDKTRRQIERDLHDGTQQRLVTLGLAVRAAEANLPPGQEGLRAELSTVADGLADVLEDLQEISRGIHPAILSKGGLAPALQALAHRSSIPVGLEISADGGLAGPVEVAAYFAVSEALANAAKHSQASRIDVSLAEREGTLVLMVSDDGVGGADASRGSGLVGLMDRVEALGGSIAVESPPGDGTRITIELEVPRVAR